MITSKSKYALNALVALAEAQGRGPVLISDLAREKEIPRKFLERILLELKARGVLRSQKGKGGGYQLARPPDLISVGDVVRWTSGPLAPVSCVSATAYAPCRECTDEASCGIRSVMKEVRDAMSGILDETSIADLARRSREATGARAQGLNFDI